MIQGFLHNLRSNEGFLGCSLHWELRAQHLLAASALSICHRKPQPLRSARCNSWRVWPVIWACRWCVNGSIDNPQKYAAAAPGGELLVLHQWSSVGAFRELAKRAELGVCLQQAEERCRTHAACYQWPCGCQELQLHHYVNHHTVHIVQTDILFVCEWICVGMWGSAHILTGSWFKFSTKS